jgi:hypothetical protein
LVTLLGATTTANVTLGEVQISVCGKPYDQTCAPKSHELVLATPQNGPDRLENFNRAFLDGEILVVDTLHKPDLR